MAGGASRVPAPEARLAGPATPGPAGPGRGGQLATVMLRPFDAVLDRLAGSRYNPLYQSGPLALVFFGLLILTGLYLFLFYKIADPHASVARVQASTVGSWMRTVHRLSADLALVATLVHLVRKVAQGHTWGPRALAWVSGVVLLGTTLLCGWTGLVMVWDRQALELARRGAEMLDRLPILSEPLARSFSGESPVPSSFFFMNLFLHVALPLGLAGTLWLHVSRLARPVLWPPRRLAWGVMALLAVYASVAPVPLAPAADLLAVPGIVALDLFYAFWVPLAEHLEPAAHLLVWVAAGTALALVPWAGGWWRRRTLARRPCPPSPTGIAALGTRSAIGISSVEESLCTGCTHCHRDCPYEAIAMVRRAAEPGRRSEWVARVDPRRCVGCGICAGSCAPMGVGPPGRDGRAQLAAARGLFADDRGGTLAGAVVVLGCDRSAAREASRWEMPGVRLVATGCAGSLHTAVVEDFLRRGASGVFVLSCPPRDCAYREGAKWVEQRLFHGREAELHARVDRRRVAYAGFSPAEAVRARQAVALFAAAARSIGVESDEDVELLRLCARTAVAPEPVAADEEIGVGSGR